MRGLEIRLKMFRKSVKAKQSVKTLGNCIVNEGKIVKEFGRKTK